MPEPLSERKIVAETIRPIIAAENGSSYSYDLSFRAVRMCAAPERGFELDRLEPDSSWFR